MLLLLFMVVNTSIFVLFFYSMFSDVANRSNSYIFVFPILVFSALTIFAFYTVSNRLNYAVATENGLRIIFPMKLKSVFLEWKDLKGYSKSDYFYGGRSAFKSQSIVIYTRTNRIYEIIKLYNFDFLNFQTNLRKFNIVCFGHEGFNTVAYKLIFRKRSYKYKDMFN